MLRTKEIEDRVERFKERLKNAGIKLTHQRLEIFREIAGTEEHPDAETVFLRVRKRMPTISLDTVYRTLWFLKDLGLVTSLGTPHDRIRFDANVHPHQHFICTQCGSIKDLEFDLPTGLSLGKGLDSVGKVERMEINFRGICSACLQKKDGNNEKSA